MNMLVNHNNVPMRLFSNHYNSALGSQDTLHKSRPPSPVIMSDSAITRNTPPKPQQLENKNMESKPEDKLPTRDINQCRLRRIQSRDRVSIADSRVAVQFPLPTSTLASTTPTHPNPDDIPTPPTPSHPKPTPSYSFPPPGLSKPTPKTMNTPEADTASSTPKELELKCDSANAADSLAESESDASIWNAFQMVSFLGGYCSRTITPSPTQDEALSPPATPVLTPASLPVKHGDSFSPDNTASRPTSGLTINTPRSHLASSPAPPVPPAPPTPPLSSATLPSVLTPRLHQTTPISHPFMLHKQRQQGFMTSWNHVRERNKYAPVMPSFFNPVRGDAPACAWTFLRDPACGTRGADDRLNGRKGKVGVFERALAGLPLTRCRNICDGVRQEQQNLLGWGIHAWSGPSKHCRYCASDTLFKGFLAYRAFEVEMRKEKELEMLRRQSMLLSLPTLDVSRTTGSADSSEEEGREDEEMDMDPGAVFLSFPYGNRSMERLNESWVNYNDLDSTSGLHAHASDYEDPEPWSDELEKQLLQSPIIRDLDEFELEEDGFEEGYVNDEEDDDSSSSGSDMSESDEEAEEMVGNGKEEGEGEKVRGTVLMSFWEEDADSEEEGWVGDVQVVGVQIQACA